MKKILITALFATSYMTLPALAQTAASETATPPTATSTDMMTAPAAADGTATAMQGEGGFVTYQEGNQLLGSGLLGANLLGADGADIGSVSDILLDRDGQIQAVIVGVGGFLGIGEKSVAIANDQLEFVLAPEAAAGTVSSTETPVAPSADQTTTAATPPAPASEPAPAATSGTSGTAAPGTNADGMMAGSGNTMAASDDDRLAWNGAGIDHIKVNFTREQLESAPAFEAAE